jgi:thiosulfate/3-mercaptopyruvate sulfurtransferase
MSSVYSTLIATDTLAAHLDDPSFVVVDVRHDLAQPDDWGETQYKAGHLPGARFVHLDRELSAARNGRNGRHPLPRPEEAAALFGRLGIGANTQVVVYDQNSGMYASRLWWMLRWLGHDAAAVLDGGMAKWEREGRSLSTDVPSPRPVTFSLRTPLATANAQDVLDSLAGKSRFIIDGRAPERFRGEVEPMDPVAGHIPGAHNWPYMHNIGPDGTFKPAAELAAGFAAFLGATPTTAVIHQCGSGVTACHNVLAMAVAGYPLTTLYPGSWSEWVADPGHPVATGPDATVR